MMEYWLLLYWFVSGLAAVYVLVRWCDDIDLSDDNDRFLVSMVYMFGLCWPVLFFYVLPLGFAQYVHRAKTRAAAARTPRPLDLEPEGRN